MARAPGDDGGRKRTRVFERRPGAQAYRSIPDILLLPKWVRCH